MIADSMASVLLALRTALKLVPNATHTNILTRLDTTSRDDVLEGRMRPLQWHGSALALARGIAGDLRGRGYATQADQLVATVDSFWGAFDAPSPLDPVAQVMPPPGHTQSSWNWRLALQIALVGTVGVTGFLLFKPSRR